MNTLKTLCTLSALSIATVLTGCGGGGGGGTSAPPPQSSAPPPPVTSGFEGGGILTKVGPGFNSVTVNGVDLDTSSATLTVTVDDSTASVGDLSVGDVVSVRATSDDNGATFTADRIDKAGTLEGPIAAGSIDTMNRTFVVLGQTVRVSATTMFDDDISPPSLEGLADGDSVEVSGLADADGEISATRVEIQTNPGLFEVVGTVSNLDTATRRFNIVDLVVDYAGAMLRDFNGGGPQDGDVVEVKGGVLGADGALIATEVEGKNPAFVAVGGDQAEIEGFVTRFSDATDFAVAGLPVTTTSQTEYERGSAADLVLNARLEAEGLLDDNGVLVATKIEYKTGAEQSDVRMEAVVDDVDSNGGTIRLLGLTVGVDNDTLLEDKSDADLEPFNLGDLNSGDYVRMRGFEEPRGSGNLIAAMLEREDVDEDTVLQGYVESETEPSLVILGVTIHTSSSTRFEGLNDESMTASEFFAAVGSGTLVKAKGFLNGGAIDAREVELED